jgi:hypothetical protein
MELQSLSALRHAGTKKILGPRAQYRNRCGWCDRGCRGACLRRYVDERLEIDALARKTARHLSQQICANARNDDWRA